MKSWTRIATIFQREIAAYFNVAIAYIFIIVFVLINGGLFMTQFFLIGRADMQAFFMTLPFLMAVFLPAVTMRQWAEERRGNTLELLLTFPMTAQDLVLGKFIAAFVFFLVALAGTATIPLMIQFLGNPDTGVILGGYLGSLLMGALFLAAGIFISGLVRDQIVAFILSMLVCFGLYLIGTGFLAASIDGWIPGFGTFLSKYVGCSGHFGTFSKGVVDNRDLLYFVIGTVLFLVLNGFWMEGRMRPKAKRIFSTAVLVSAGIFLTANWFLGEFSLGRFDLTEGKIYTISPATQKILRDLKAPLTAKLYISPSEKMPTGMKTLEQDIVHKLDEFRIAAQGKFQYKVFHMEAANVVEEPKGDEESLEESMSSKGIHPFQVQSIESDEVGVRLVYAALSLAYKEKPEQVIPRVMPESLYELEYLIASMAFRMTLDRNPKVALVAPYENKMMNPQMMALISQLGGRAAEQYRVDEYDLLSRALYYEGYDIARIRLTKEEPIPEDAMTLVVIEPDQLSQRQLYEINRFLTGGGSIFLAVQNFDYEYDPSGGRLAIHATERNSGINPLLAEWGLAVNPSILADNESETISLSGGAQIGPFAVSVPVKLPIHIVIPPASMNQDLSITSRLSPVFYLWGSALEIDPEKIEAQELKVQTLITSSEESWLIPYVRRPLIPRDFSIKPTSATGPFPLAVYVEGPFRDVYEGTPVPPWPERAVPPGLPGQPEEDAEPEEEILPPVTPAPGKLILIGAATPFQKKLIRSGGHLTFFLNSMDVLTLGDELVHIRSKQPIDRALGRISTAEKVLWRFFVTLFVPALIALAGALRVFMRRQAKQNYLRKLESQTS